MKFPYNVLTNPPRRLCIHVYSQHIDMKTGRSWVQCIACGYRPQ